MTVVSINCSRCGCRLERQELAAGKCVYCQSGELESEVFQLEQAAAAELAAREQEALWQA